MNFRPDLTSNLIHLTKGNDEVLAFNTLLSILAERKLRGNTGHILGAHKCVCFSEAPLSAIAMLMSMRAHTAVRYQPIGVSFSKEFIFSLGGRPVIYQKDDEYAALPAGIQYRHVSFNPLRRPKPVDFTWEREWRVFTDEIPFSPADCTVILPTRHLADELRNQQVEAWRKSGRSLTYSQILPWHFVVLEDLGVRLDFPKMSVAVTVTGSGAVPGGGTIAYSASAAVSVGNQPAAQVNLTANEPAP